MNQEIFNDYDDVLEFIFRQLPIYQRQGPKALKYDLSNITTLMDALGNPQRDFKSIHIAGTNGKGSTAHLIASAFQANGHRTGLYTSPHYRDYRERIKVDGELINKDFVIDFFNCHYKLINKLSPSYFEISVGLAFSYFKSLEVDIAIIEVGLGGRLDSTNIILPILSVITNISLDHTQTLGDSIPQIAGEKAGIIKSGIPVLIGEYQEETSSVFQKIAQKNKAPLHYAKDLDITLDDTISENGMEGPFYVNNVTTALGAIELIKKYNPAYGLNPEKTISGIQNVASLTKFIGRWQVINNNPKIIVDGAHNLAGWKESLKYISRKDYDQLHMVIGFVSDKSYKKILSILPLNAKYYFCQADIPRALPSQVLQIESNALGLAGEAFSNVRNALESAKTQAGENDLILISGSIFVAGEVL